MLTPVDMNLNGVFSICLAIHSPARFDDFLKGDMGCAPSASTPVDKADTGNAIITLTVFLS